MSKDSDYRDLLLSLPLFCPNDAIPWTDLQKHRFAAMFYHIRGYFIEFMWYVANFTTSDKVKSIILDNIGEEIGLGGKTSHEQLYARFAKEWGVDIQEEIMSKAHCFPFIQFYNKHHIDWLQQNNETARLAAFAAYERLDNIDYLFLYRVGKHLGLSDEGLKFFKVHTLVEHFEPALPLLEAAWQNNPKDIIIAFDFIYAHQGTMWKTLSESVFNHAEVL